jgi:drug/metabolite transporter superfamily protein YnfA
VILILYGIIPAFQPAHFGRVYAAYGGMCIILSFLWDGSGMVIVLIGSTSQVLCSVLLAWL